MLKNFFLMLTFAIAITCLNIGCGGPGPIVEGKAQTGDDYAQSDDVDHKNRKAPTKGIGPVQ